MLAGLDEALRACFEKLHTNYRIVAEPDLFVVHLCGSRYCASPHTCGWRSSALIGLPSDGVGPPGHFRLRGGQQGSAEP